MTESNEAASALNASAGLLQVNVPLTPAYSNRGVTVEQTTTTISIPLVPGEQRTTTPAQVVGAVADAANPNLIGTLTVWSDYDPTFGVLTLLGTDFESSDATHLRTYLQSAREQTLKQYAYHSASNPRWNYAADSASDMAQLFQDTLRSANDAIVEAAIAQGITTIVRTPPPEVSPELAEKLRLVYRDGVFKEVYDPEKEYGAEDRVFNIQSTFYGTITLAAKDYFANVIGSTEDPKVASKAWRVLWEEQFEVAKECTSQGFKGFACNTPLYGGHVILGKTAMEMPKGSNSVFIMPICNAHNNDDSVYMAPLVYVKGVALHNYME